MQNANSEPYWCYSGCSNNQVQAKRNILLQDKTKHHANPWVSGVVTYRRISLKNEKSAKQKKVP